MATSEARKGSEWAGENKSIKSEMNFPLYFPLCFRNFALQYQGSSLLAPLACYSGCRKDSGFLIFATTPLLLREEFQLAWRGTTTRQTFEDGQAHSSLRSHIALFSSNLGRIAISFLLAILLLRRSENLRYMLRFGVYVCVL